MNISFALPALTPSLQFRPFACWWSLLPEGQSWTPWTCYDFTSWRGVSWPGLLLFSIGLLHEFLLGVDLLPAGNHQIEKWKAKNDVVWAVKTRSHAACNGPAVFSPFHSEIFVSFATLTAFSWSAHLFSSSFWSAFYSVLCLLSRNSNAFNHEFKFLNAKKMECFVTSV